MAKKKKDNSANRKANPEAAFGHIDLENMPSMADLLGSSTAKEQRQPQRPTPTYDRKKKKQKPPPPASHSSQKQVSNDILDLDNLCGMDQLLETPANQTNDTLRTSPNTHKKCPQPPTRSPSAPAEATDKGKNEQEAPESLEFTLEGAQNMGDLLEAHQTHQRFQSTVARIVSNSRDQIRIRLESGEEAVLEQRHLKDWQELNPGQRILVEYRHRLSSNPAEQHGQFRLVRLLGPESNNANDKRASRNTPSTTDSSSYTFFVLDGSNICRSYDPERSPSSLAPLLTLIRELQKKGKTFKCVFDASERYALAKNRAEASAVYYYETIMNHFPHQFGEAPNGEDADNRILRLAEHENGAVISNDRFDKPGDDHERIYPWVMASVGNRMIRGSVEENRLIVPALNINTALRTDLDEVIQELNLVPPGEES